jgi:hypothetical protein
MKKEIEVASGKSNPEWVAAKVAAESLGFSIDHLRRLRESKVLKKGEHWRAINPLALRPSYRYNIETIQKTLDG